MTLPALDVLLPTLGAVLLGGLVRGFAGFGSAMVVVTLVSVIDGPVQGVLTLTVVEIPAMLVLFPIARRGADRGALLPICLAALPAIPLGVSLLIVIDGELMSRVIGAVVLASVVVLASGVRLSRRPGRAAAAATGALSGMLTGSTGVGGPPVVLYFLAGDGPAAGARASLIAYFMFTDLVALTSLLLSGEVAATGLVKAVSAAPVYVLGVVAGSRLFGVASERAFRRGALLLLTCIGAFALLR